MDRSIPLYTTDEPPVTGQRVVSAWLEWVQRRKVGDALNGLAAQAIANGAHAIVGLRLMQEPVYGFNASVYTAYGTAVVFG